MPLERLTVRPCPCTERGDVPQLRLASHGRASSPDGFETVRDSSQGLEVGAGIYTTACYCLLPSMIYAGSASRRVLTRWTISR
jgi:hypothetical protein